MFSTVSPRDAPSRIVVSAFCMIAMYSSTTDRDQAYDLAIFCQMILNNGTYNGVKILEPWTVDLIFHNYNTKCTRVGSCSGWSSSCVDHQCSPERRSWARLRAQSDVLVRPDAFASDGGSHGCVSESSEIVRWRWSH
jgi:hypothetical protein